MKTKILIFFLPFLFILQSCASVEQNYNDYIREVRYFKGTIQNVDKKTIFLANGSAWTADRLIIAVNMSEVFFVLSNVLDDGYVYIDGTKLRVKHSNGYDFRYNYGYLNYIKALHNKNRVIELVDGSFWVVAKGGEKLVKDWLSTSEVVLSENEDVMINPYKMETVRVAKITKSKKNKNPEQAIN